MGELDEAWAAALSEAEQRARLAGRKDVAEYLSLKNSNDLLRKAGVDWLVSGVYDAGGRSESRRREHSDLKERGPSFPIGSSTMVGHLLTLTNGVRTLYVEAGWPRSPRDGFVRGGGLACANIRHLGIQTCGRGVVVDQNPTPVRQPGNRSTRNTSFLHESDIRRHIQSSSISVAQSAHNVFR